MPELRECEAAASFCEWMNDTFDALNRKDLTDGVEPGNIDFKVSKRTVVVGSITVDG